MASTGAATTGLPETETATASGASERVVDAVIDGIRLGLFVPGQRLSEPDLAQRWNVSRSSVREALRHLEAAGMITLNRFRGAYVSELDRQAALDLLDVIEALVKLAARLAAQNPDLARRSTLVQAAEAIADAASGDNSHHFLDRRRDFYAVLIAVGGNDELRRAIPLSRTNLFRARLEKEQGATQRLARAGDYSRIAAAVVAGDATEAERAVAAHVERTRTMIRDYREDRRG